MFKSSNDFCMYIERLKIDNDFETYLETVTWFAENESDHEMPQIVRHLNKKIVEEIKKEAYAMGAIGEGDIDKETVAII